MSISDLTNTKWSLKSSLMTYPGGTYTVKTYDVNISTPITITDITGSNPRDTFTSITIGYNSGAEDNEIKFYYNGDGYFIAGGTDTKTLPDEYNTIKVEYFEITGGTDATNSVLIDWLSDNADEYVPPTPPPDDVVVSYMGSEITSLSDSGTRTLLTGGTYCEDDITIQYTKQAGGLESPYTEYDGNLNVKFIDLKSATVIPRYFMISAAMTSDFSISGMPSVSTISSYAFSFNSLASPMSSYITLNLDGLQTVETYAFAGCDWLGAVSAPNTTVASGTYVFMSCIHLSSVYFPMLSSAGAGFLSNTGITSVEFPRLSSVPGNMFFGCSSLISVSLPQCSLIFGSAFVNCFSLSNLYIPNVTKLSGSYIFNRCSALRELNLSLLASISSTTYGSNFQSTGLVSFTATSLSVINAPGTFMNCKSLTDVSLPVLVSVGASTFYGCSSLRYIELPRLQSMSSYCFAYCTSLTGVSFPSLTTVVGQQTFANCSALQSIYFPGLSSSLNVSYMFSYCSNLSLVSLPKATTISGSAAFRSCYRLISIFLLGSSVCALGSAVATVFPSTPISTYTTVAGRAGSIFVPSSLLTNYKTATNWTTISSKIFAYEDYFDSNGNPL